VTREAEISRVCVLQSVVAVMFTCAQQPVTYMRRLTRHCSPGAQALPAFHTHCLLRVNMADPAVHCLHMNACLPGGLGLPSMHSNGQSPFPVSTTPPLAVCC
jgi:hypothetical protein